MLAAEAEDCHSLLVEAVSKARGMHLWMAHARAIAQCGADSATADAAASRARVAAVQAERSSDKAQVRETRPRCVRLSLGVI